MSARDGLFDLARTALARTPTAQVFVPGRLEFLGKHTDYAGGRSLICAIERGIAAVVSPRRDRTIRVIDATEGAVVEFGLSAELAPTLGHWSNYPMTVARRLARNFGDHLRGADIALASDLPRAGGLSSSSALMIAIFLALDAVNDLCHRDEYHSNIHSDEDLAGYLATIENGQTFGTLAGDRGVGTHGGSEDHTAILCGRSGVLRQYSFCPVKYERDVPLPPDHAFVVATSGVVAEKTGAARDAYNRAAQLASQLLELWRSSTGRDDPTLAAAVRSSPHAVDRFRQVLGEQSQDLSDRFEQFVAESEQIIPAAGDALAHSDLATLDSLVARSQDLAERFLKNQVPETIALVRLANECDAIASSAFGAGFGGSVWALVNRSEADEFLSRWRNRYSAEFPARSGGAVFFVTRATDGASVESIVNEKPQASH
jgi:galactokinase